MSPARTLRTSFEAAQSGTLSPELKRVLTNRAKELAKCETELVIGLEVVRRLREAYKLIIADQDVKESKQDAIQEQERQQALPPSEASLRTFSVSE
jgi:hypothetical protein